MSTIPHDPSHATDAAQLAPIVQPASYEAVADEAVREFESVAEWLRISRPPTSELRDLCRKVAAYTAQLFAGVFTIKVKNDPEITDDLYFVFEVVIHGDVDEVAAKDNEWHRRLSSAVGKRSELFCLSV